MSPRVNLLPQDLRRRRQQRKRRQFWISLCILIAVSEGGAIFLSGARAREVHIQQSRAAKLKTSLKQEISERNVLRSKSESLSKELQTAERLREKHYWSRWLGSLSLIVPTKIILTEVRTEPSRFAETAVLAGDGRPSTDAPPGVHMVRVAGAANEHGDLLNLIEQINHTKIFRSVRLEEARRDRMGENETIGFTLICEW